MGVFASCHEASVAFPEPHLGFPPDVLEHLGLFFEPSLQLSADLGGITIRPGAFDQDASGMGMARFGDGAVAALRTGGLF